MVGSSDTFLSFDWFITDYEIKGPFDSNPVFKLFLLSFLPVMLFLLVALIWMIIYLINSNLVHSMKRYLIISFISIVFILHPKITEESINSFRWFKIDEGGERVSRIDTDIEWYSFTHLKWWLIISLPIIIIWVISLPLFGLILLSRHIKDEGHNNVKECFLILYQGLKPDKFYWEFLNTFRKILMISLLLLETDLQIVFSSILLMVNVRLIIILKPYKRMENNNIEIQALLTESITILSTLIFLLEDEIVFLNGITLFLVLFLNIIFLMRWVFLLTKLYKDKSKSAKFVSIFHIIFHIVIHGLRMTLMIMSY